MDRSKALVTRAALERVLARAAELQHGTGDAGETPDALTEAQVVELGREVGLSPEHLRQALAEERARVEPLTVAGSGLGHRMFGADQIAAQRVVGGTPERLLATLDRWMQKEEWLRVIRQRADRIVWEPRRGFLGELRRVLGSREYALYRCDDIAATVVPVDDGSTLVRLEAGFAGLRRTMASQTAAGTVVGGATAGAFVLMGVMLPVAVLPVSIGAIAFYSSRRSHQYAIRRGQLALEQLLDRLERGDFSQPPSLIRLIESALPPTR